MGYQVVPWSCDDEWKHVFDCFFSDDTDKQQLAIDIVEIWRIRAAGGVKISLAIQLTADLVQSRLSYLKDGSTNSTCLLLSAVFIRFVSLLSDLDQVRKYKQPVSKICNDLGIPVWISELRNESAHANLPSIDVTMAAVDICLNYLKESYWFPHWHILFEMKYCSFLHVQKLTERWARNDIDQNVIKQELKALLKKDRESGNLYTDAAKCIENVLSNDNNIELALFLKPFVDVLTADFVFSLLTGETLSDSKYSSELLSVCLKSLTLDQKQSLKILRSCLRSGNLDLLSSKEFDDFLADKLEGTKINIGLITNAVSILKKRPNNVEISDHENVAEQMEEQLKEIEIMLSVNRSTKPKSQSRETVEIVPYNALELILN
ncbi:uncharacterized protein LOC142335074 [Convolutriloba macropyga]|uniref:uncharacterized protein LOC142335074 n=1 Tax=Convolutriloba macropyga TaxID=536237 RepID=UPI003F51DA36